MIFFWIFGFGLIGGSIDMFMGNAMPAATVGCEGLAIVLACFASWLTQDGAAEDEE